MVSETAKHNPYSGGQLLRARDLQADYQAERAFLWWHTAALHATWGIAQGLTVQLAQHGQGVLVNAGLAYDSLGQELLLAETVGMALPANLTSGSGVLSKNPLVLDLVAGIGDRAAVVRRPDPGWPACPDHKMGLSTGKARKLSRLTPSPCVHRADPLGRLQLTWLRPEEVRRGLEVRLVRATVDGGIIRQLQTRVRRYVRPLAQPYLASGRTPPGTKWQEWSVSSQHLGWAVHIDTSAAGFVLVPRYFASLTRDLLADQPGLARSLAGPFTSVWQPRPDGFTFVIVFAAASDDAAKSAAKSFRELFGQSVPQVSWVGIEPKAQDGIVRGSDWSFPLAVLVSIKPGG